MITKSSGFSLIELLVVIAIIGVLSSVGLIAYNGYVDGTKQTSAKNMMPVSYTHLTLPTNREV